MHRQWDGDDGKGGLGVALECHFERRRFFIDAFTNEIILQTPRIPEIFREEGV